MIDPYLAFENVNIRVVAGGCEYTLVGICTGR